MPQTRRQRKPPVEEQIKQSIRLSNIASVLILLVIIFLTVLVTRFFEKLHYDNLLQQKDAQITKLHADKSASEHDFKYLIQNFNAPLECYQLESSYAQHECRAFDT